MTTFDAPGASTLSDQATFAPGAGVHFEGTRAFPSTPAAMPPESTLTPAMCIMAFY